MLRIGKENIKFSFDPAEKPVAAINSGEEVVFETLDCYAGQISADGMSSDGIDMTRNNPITGPLYIKDAVPGDVLKIEVLEILPLGDAVMCVREGKGIYGIPGFHCRRFPIKEGKLLFDRGLQLPVKPMIGVIGTCPAERTIPQVPGEHGGNLDVKDLGAGCTLYLPVLVEGALLSVGDCHALQGDGESAICGAEMSAEVRLRITLCKEKRELPTPFLETEKEIMTMAAAETLDEAALTAARNMHLYLTRTAGLTQMQAAMLLSLVGDIRISQVVNPKKGCRMSLAKEYIAGLQG